MKAIETKFIPCTNHRGSRVTAYAEGGPKMLRVTLSWDHALNSDQNHDAAAVALIRKMGWAPVRMVSGGRPDGKGNVYALMDNGERNVFDVKADAAPSPSLGPCHCKRGQQRDNCPDCEGTGHRLDFAAIRKAKA